MSFTPKISIITPCYNHAHHVREMIDSVLTQSFKDFELIIVNDGSTDTTSQVLNKIKHPQIHVFHSTHQGTSEARNLAISKTRSDIILNMDADDKMAPKLLEKAYHVIESNPDWGIVYTDIEYFGAKSGLFTLDSYSLKTMLFDNVISALSFFRKSDWQHVGGYSSTFIYGLEDWDLWLSIIELGRQVYKIPESLVYYRKYKDSSKCRSGQRIINPKKMRHARLTIFHRHLNLYLKEPEVYACFSDLEKGNVTQNKYLRKVKNLYRKLKNRKKNP